MGADREPLGPLLRLVPGLGALPRAALGVYPTPVERFGEAGPDVWIKREDLGGASLGGNKVRSLETLLGGIGAGDRVATVGPRGSNHVLATAFYATRLGARVAAAAWPQPLTDDTRRVWLRTRSLARVYVAPLPAVPFVVAALRLSGARWIPLGGSSPLGVLGHAAAALELAEQVAEGVVPEPARIVVALGSGGTAAGLALGIALAGMRANLVAVRVGPRFVSNARTVRRLARRASAILARHGGPAPRPLRFRVEHDFAGPGYGVPTPASDAATTIARRGGITVEPAYTAKTLAAVLATRGSGPTVYWHTFDARAVDGG